jgi:carbon monoxide dehydrogenase subunit G
MPTARFQHEAETDRTVEEVWLRLQDVETWANIGPVEEVWDPVHDEKGLLLGYHWSTSVGPTRYKGRADVVETREHSFMTLDLDGGEIAGVLTTRIEHNGGGARIVVDLRIASKGALSAMFFPLVAEVVGRGLPEQVDRFVAGLEGPR